MSLALDIAEANAFLRGCLNAAGRKDFTPRVGLILGTGFGGIAPTVEDAIEVFYRDVPHMPACTAQFHAGSFIFGTISGVPAVVANGRYHAYEGYSAQQIAMPVWIMEALGIQTLITTNTAGGINADYQPGDYCVMSDHINFMGTNPIVGQEASELKRRYFTMEQVFDIDLRKIARASARKVDATAHEGVYLGLLGPNFETPAEIRAFRTWGADTVAMSTIEEVIAARQMGLRVLGISLVSDKSYDGTGEIPDATKIAGRIKESIPKSTALLQTIISAL